MRRLLTTAVLALAGMTALFFARDGGADARPRQDLETREPLLVATELPAGSAANWRPDADASERYPRGSRVVLLRPGVSGPGSLRVLSEGLPAAGAPAVRSDGASVVFAGLDPDSDRWCIYEASVAGGSPRLVASAPADCIDPVPLPKGRVAFVVRGADGAYLAVSTGSGAKSVDRITFGPGMPALPSILPDGRLLFSMLDPDGGRPASLFTMNPDGSMLEPLRGQHGEDSPELRARWSDEGLAFLSEERGARLVSMARPRAADAPLAEHLVDSDVPRPLTVEPLPGGGWVLCGEREDGGARRDSAVFLLTPGQEPPVLLRSLAGSDLVEATPVLARDVPPDRPSEVKPEQGTGLVVCYDVDWSDGRVGPSAMAGEAATVLVEGLVSAADHSPRVLAQLAVAEDGSVCAEVPADLPLRWTTQDREGRALATSAWFWVRPGEVRSCFGCHESRDSAPRNRPVQALRAEPQRVPGLEGVAQQ